MPAGRFATPAPATIAWALCATTFAWGGLRFETPAGPWLLAASGLLWLAATRTALARPPSSLAIVLGAVVLRAVAIWASPRTSGDVFRYAWEAEVWLSGADPYRWAPDSPKLAELARTHRELWEQVEHRSIPAVYPPLAQAAFIGAALVARAIEALGLASLESARAIAFRALALAGEAAVLAILARWLAREGRSRAALVAWAWCPLTALEFASAAHFDTLGIALMLLAIAPFAALTGARRALLLACGVAVKFLPLGAAPFAVRGAGRKRAWIAFAAGSLLLLAPMLVGLAHAEFGASGPGVYSSRWASTSILFRALEAPLWPLLGDAHELWNARIVARALAAALWLAWLAHLLRRNVSQSHAAFSAAGAFLLLSPTFHPWYAAWVLPWCVIAPREPAARAFAWLVALAPLQYVVLARYRASGEWSEPAWLWPLMFGPFLVLLAFAARPRRAP